MTEVLNIKNVSFTSINSKYKKSASTGRLYLSPEYRDFKQLVNMSARKGRIDPPYRVVIEIATALDIDNPLKAILDGLQSAGVIEDDAQVVDLFVGKQPIKRGEPGSLAVFIETAGSGSRWIEMCRREGA